MDKFWMVLRADGGHPPIVRHDTTEKARAEAARLAKKENAAFVVLEAQSLVEPVYKTPPIRWLPLWPKPKHEFVVRISTEKVGLRDEHVCGPVED